MWKPLVCHPKFLLCDCEHWSEVNLGCALLVVMWVENRFDGSSIKSSQKLLLQYQSYKNTLYLDTS